MNRDGSDRGRGLTALDNGAGGAEIIAAVARREIGRSGDTDTRQGGGQNDSK